MILVILRLRPSSQTCLNLNTLKVLDCLIELECGNCKNYRHPDLLVFSLFILLLAVSYFNLLCFKPKKEKGFTKNKTYCLWNNYSSFLGSTTSLFAFRGLSVDNVVESSVVIPSGYFFALLYT